MVGMSKEDRFWFGKVRYRLHVERLKGCCYWHISRLLEAHYPFWLDSFFNLFRGLLKYAEIHAVLMRKKQGLL